MKKFNKVLSALVIGAVILSTGAVAFAAEGSPSTWKTGDSKGRAPVAGKMNRGGDKSRDFSGKGIVKYNIEDNLKTLVSLGVLTQEESDKILALSKEESTARQAEMDKVKNMTEEERKAYFDSKKDQPREKNDIFASAVSKGIITQAKADSAKAKLQETRDAEKKAKLTESLNSLITAGTITKEQSEKVLAYVNDLEASKPAKGTDTTAAPKTEKKNPLSALVDDGTLTQAQLDAVSKVLPMGGGLDHGGHGGPGMDKPAKASADVVSSATTK